MTYRNEQVLTHFIWFYAKDKCKMNDLGDVSQFIRVEIHSDRVRKNLKIVQAC